MLDAINGSSNSNSAEPLRSNPTESTPVDSTPPRGRAAGVEEVEPDVAVEISDMAQARMVGMMSPAQSGSESSMQADQGNGGVNFGVDRGGFAWPLDAASSSTADGADFESMDGWEASANTVNGVLVDGESSESAYIALGKSTVNASK